jgi:hypothetical protein
MSSASASAFLLHCGAVPLSSTRTKDQLHDVLRYLSGHMKPKAIKRRTSIFKLEHELLANLNPKPKVEELCLQENVFDGIVSRRLLSFDKVASQGGMSRIGSHPASCGQIMRIYPLLSDGCTRHTHSSPVPAFLHSMGFKTSPPELVTVRDCEEYVVPYPRLPCDITASVYTLYKLKPGTRLPHPPPPTPPPPLNNPLPQFLASLLSNQVPSTTTSISTSSHQVSFPDHLSAARALNRLLRPRSHAGASFCDVLCSPSAQPTSLLTATSMPLN